MNSRSSAPTPSPGPLVRRNGRQQACAPCAARKIACDHEYPVCRRCRKRRTESACVYSPTISSPAPRTTSRLRRSSEGRLLPPPVSSAAVRSATAAALQAPSEPTLLPAGANEDANGGGLPPDPADVPPGYLGFTSFSAIYEEAQHTLQKRGTPPVTRRHSPNRVPSHHESPNGLLSAQNLQKGVSILRKVPDLDALLPQPRHHANPNNAWFPLATQALLERLDFFAAPLRSKDPRALEDVARTLARNTARPWRDEDEPNAAKWLDSFSGGNLRWECLGILFTFWASATIATKPQRREALGHEDGHAVHDREHEIVLMYKKAAEDCYALCWGLAPNTLMLFLLYRMSIVDSMVSGDASPTTWLLHGQVVAMTTGLGLHAIKSSENYVPTASSEAKRRLVWQIYNVDTVAALFCGRPPLLSKRYMVTPEPLELSDQDLMNGDAASLARAASMLDADGWNPNPRLYSTTLLRNRAIICKGSDAVIELALGDPALTSVEQLLDLRAHLNKIMDHVAPIVRFSWADVRDASLDPQLLYAKTIVRLEHLLSCFYVLRMLVQRQHPSRANLIRVSFDMVETTLIFWTNMDKMSGLHGEFEWLVMAYAAPGGGILCNELLNPTMQDNPVPGLARSDIIQKLSLLVGFLDWVSPYAPNGNLCIACKAVIQHVLDRALNGPSQEVVLQPNGVAGSAMPTDINDFNWDVWANNNYFDFDFLDTFDWLVPDASLVPPPGG